MHQKNLMFLNVYKQLMIRESFVKIY